MQITDAPGLLVISGFLWVTGLAVLRSLPSVALCLVGSGAVTVSLYGHPYVTTTLLRGLAWTLLFLVAFLQSRIESSERQRSAARSLALASGCLAASVPFGHFIDSLSGERIVAVERAFQETDGFAALAYQIRMGGTGKNFQVASVVVLMEPQFTSALEEQAISRAHRMGQTEPVFVHRLIAEGTVDEHLAKLVDRKAALAENLADRSHLAEKLVQDERKRFGFPLDPVPTFDPDEEEER